MAPFSSSGQRQAGREVRRGQEAFVEDAMVSVDRLRSRGAAVTVTTFDGIDHVNGWIHAMPRAVMDFASLAQ